MNILEKIDMYLNEELSSGPVADKKIHDECKKYGIIYYSINNDMTIDVTGDVDLSKMKLKTLPLNFNKVTGDFYCSFNNLTSLEGCPKIIGGEFSCNDNELKSLKYGPIKIGTSYNCSKNNLTDLIGAPTNISRLFDCSHNPLKSLKGSPKKVKTYYCMDTPSNIKNNDIIKVCDVQDKDIETGFDTWNPSLNKWSKRFNN